MKILSVGAGITNLALARCLAEGTHKVVIIDRKDHIGGNCFDYFDENSIDIHAYGTHIFHTDNTEVWRFLSQFTQWYPYQHEVKALVDGQPDLISIQSSRLIVAPKSCSRRPMLQKMPAPPSACRPKPARMAIRFWLKIGTGGAWVTELPYFWKWNKNLSLKP